MEELFNKINLEGPSYIGSRLEDITRGLLVDLKNGGKPKHTNYIVITDGAASESPRPQFMKLTDAWRTGDAPEDAIVHIARQLDKYQAPSSQVR